jgi:hypothetical protein
MIQRILTGELMILEDGMIQVISTNGRFIPGVQAMLNLYQWIAS